MPEPVPTRRAALRRRFYAMLVAPALLLAGAVDGASTLNPPQGRVVLTVSGNISVTNAGDGARFDRAMLETLGTTRVRTRTPWTDSANVFEGVLVRDLLRSVGAGTDSFLAMAHDDYQTHVTGIDFDKYPIILAMKVDGKTMRLRDKGPLWLIFPWDDHPELHAEVNSALSVWQLKSIVID